HLHPDALTSFPTRRSSDLFDNVSKAYGDRLLIDKLSFKVPAGAIVGIIGPNGAGKSTLFRMIAGREQPDTGTVNIGKTVKLAFVDRKSTRLNSSHVKISYA